MPIDLSKLEAALAITALIGFLVSLGKWIQMREAISNRVIEVDEKLKDIDEWRINCAKRTDEVYVRRESCSLHMLNIEQKYENLTELIGELKTSVKTLTEEVRKK